VNPDAINTVIDHVQKSYETRITGERTYKIEGADLARPRVQEAIDGVLPWTEVFTGPARGIMQNQLASNQWNARAAKALLAQEPARLSALVRHAWAGELEAAATELDALLQDERIGSDATAFRSIGARASVLSFFRFLADPKRHPMFRPGHVATALRELGHPPLESSDPTTLEDRLDAQAVLWACNRLEPKPVEPATEEGSAAVTPSPESPTGVDASATDLASQMPAIQAWLKSRGLHFPDDLVAAYLAALLTKPFVVLTGLSGTGKTQLALKVNELLGPVFVVPVKPDWTDTRGVLGYLNPITNRFEKTRALEAVLAASASNKLVTLVLDEMNLAHVERYFADVLSVMESEDTIPLHASDTVEADQGVPKQLAWPKNLLVVGTVNADETTYPFSPKVLDRAFVLDVSRVEARAYLRESRWPAQADKPAIDSFQPSRDWRTLGVDRDDTDFVLDLHAELTEAGRPFGYRTIGESLAFLTHARAFVGYGLRPQDALVATKILPRFHGRRHELEPAIQGLARWLRLDLDAENGAAPPSAFPWTELLLRRMKRQLDAEGYVESMVG